MSLKHWIGWAVLLVGVAGVYNQYSAYTASAAGTAATPVSALNAIDPAVLLKISGGTGLLTAGMMTDVAIAAVGAWMAFTP